MKESNFWSWHILAAVVILVLLTLHMGVMHLDNLLLALGYGYEDVLSYKSVFERSKTVYYLVLYLILLGAALYHGLYGFRSMLLELRIGRKLEKPISIIIPIGGFALFIYGAYAIIVGFTSLGG